MSERKLLAAAAKRREVCESIDVCMDVKKEFTSMAQLVYKQIQQWYAKDVEAKSVDLTLLTNALKRKHKNHADQLEFFVNTIGQEEVSAVNIQDEIIDTKACLLMQDIGGDMINFTPYENLADRLEQLKELYNKELWDQSLATSEYEVYTSDDFSQVLSGADPSQYLPLYPDKLSTHLGGGVWRKGSIIVYGRPDMGKTTFMVNLACGFLNGNHKVLYLLNEDAVEQLLVRFIQCFNKIPKEEALKDKEGYLSKAIAKGLNNLVLLETPAGTIAHLEALIKEHQPEVLIVDQLRGMQSNVDNRVLELEQVAKAIRQFAKKYNLVSIGVTQAGNSAENKPVLDMNDIDWSKTGIPGACDLMIGLGGNLAMIQTGLRLLSFPKNKINGNKEPLELVMQTEIVGIS